MGKKKLSEIEKARALIKIKLKVPVMKIAVELNGSKQTVFMLLKAAKGLPDGIVPKRKIGSGRKRKTSAMTNHIFGRKVLISPSITPASLKKKHPKLLEGYKSKQFKISLKMTLAFPAGMQQKASSDRENEKKEINFCKEIPALDIETVAKSHIFR